MTLIKTDTQNFAISVGTDKEIAFVVTDSNGLVDLTGSTLTFKMYGYISQIVPDILKTSDNPNEIEVQIQEGATLGQAIVKILPTDTSSLDTKQYYFSITYLSVTGVTKTILTGFFYITSAGQVHVNLLRDRLQEAGENTEQYVPNEYRPVIGDSIVYTKRPNIVAVYGVWLTNDTSKTGTNYFTNGSFDSNNGMITLGSSTPTKYGVVHVDYTWSTGMTDDLLLETLEVNRIFCVGYTGIDFLYGDTGSRSQQQVEQMALARCILSAVLIINSPNSAQLGYNFRIDEFEFQSKLWGEGMIAQSLFALYLTTYEEWKQNIGKDIKTVLAPKLNATYSKTGQELKEFVRSL